MVARLGVKGDGRETVDVRSDSVKNEKIVTKRRAAKGGGTGGRRGEEGRAADSTGSYLFCN